MSPTTTTRWYYAARWAHGQNVLGGRVYLHRFPSAAARDRWVAAAERPGYSHPGRAAHTLREIRTDPDLRGAMALAVLGAWDEYE